MRDTIWIERIWAEDDSGVWQLDEAPGLLEYKRVYRLDPRSQAEAELKEEKYRIEVDEEKENLRKKKPWFPWRIRIERRK